MFLKKVIKDFQAFSPKLPHRLLNYCLTLEAERLTQALPVCNFTIFVVLLRVLRCPMVCVAWCMPLLGQAPLTQRGCGSKITVTFSWVIGIKAEQEQHGHFWPLRELYVNQPGDRREYKKVLDFTVHGRADKEAVRKEEASCFLQSGIGKIPFWITPCLLRSLPQQAKGKWLHPGWHEAKRHHSGEVCRGLRTLRLRVGKDSSLPGTGWQQRWQPWLLLRSLSPSFNVRSHLSPQFQEKQEFR